MTIDAWQLIWDELRETRETVVSWEGYLLCSRDRKLDERTAKAHHTFSVAKAIAAGRPVPETVRKEYEARIIKNGIEPEHARRAAFDPPPSKTQLLNAKGKPFTWSYTALTAFENCPAAYAAERFFCTSTFVETEAIKWGNRVHKVAEDILNGKTVKETADVINLLLPFTATMLKAQQAGAELLVEQEIALNENMQPVAWFAKDAWFRGKLDATIVKDGKASIFDWKTGKVKDDPDQLRIFAAALSILRPEIETFAPKFIFLKDKKVLGCAEITKSEIPGIWEGVLGRVERMKQAWVSSNFPARASGLCPWCSIYNECKYARRK